MLDQNQLDFTLLMVQIVTCKKGVRGKPYQLLTFTHGLKPADNNALNRSAVLRGTGWMI